MKFYVAIGLAMLAALVSCEIPQINKVQCGGIGEEMSAADTADVVSVWSENRHLLKDSQGKRVVLK